MKGKINIARNNNSNNKEGEKQRQKRKGEVLKKLSGGLAKCLWSCHMLGFNFPFPFTLGNFAVNKR